ncbi:cache domain-containing protein [Undibacterium sp. TS12]|uniref:cache domain-containing protein n=1 Tax=Undibacterium sp. TS12 TaxID=2908202 RepID=UPI001F4CB532|nr:cache domain-containing protein [Undibacterium sp. TS12]MCH8619998.1 cache domain-containing protein [Undibacterium sp. TS12]
MRQFIRVMLACVGFFFMASGQLAQAADKGTADEAIALVKKAAAYLKENGKEKAYAEFNNPSGQFVNKDLYVFVYNTNGDGINRAHGANAKMVGKNLLELKDADGMPIVKSFLDVANSKTGHGWVDYKWPNPTTKQMEPKSTYIERVGDVLIGCGIYK